MNFDLSEEQKLLAESVQRFLEKEYGFEQRKKIVASGPGYSDATWKSIADLGLLALPISTDHGGFGGTAVDLMTVMEKFGEALVVEPYASTVVCARILDSGMHARLLATIAEGGAKLALAHLETDPVKARRQGDHYVVDGTKQVVLHAPQADKLLVSARTGEATSLFLVDAAASGVTMRPYRTIDELRGADVEMRGVRVAAGDRIGQEGAGGILLQDGLDYATALLCAEAVGVMKFACETTLDYLKGRQQFGVPIGSFQALQHRMVDMYIDLEQARSMASLACAAMSGVSADRGRTIAAAKLRICDAAERVSKESVQLHGGMGMTEELKVSHAFRRLTMIRQLYGHEDAQLAKLAAAWH